MQTLLFSLTERMFRRRNLSNDCCVSPNLGSSDTSD